MKLSRNALIAAVFAIAAVPVGWTAVQHVQRDDTQATAPAGDDVLGATAPMASMTVTVAKAERRPVAATVMAAGTVVPWREIPVAAETAGLAVSDVLVEEGDTVTAGQLLARLDDSLLQAQIEQQRAAIAEAQANLDAAKSDLARGEELVGRGTISKEAAEQRRTAAKTAEARLAVAKAAMSELDARLAQTEIRAPADGYVSSRSAVEGKVAQVGTELFRIVRDGRLEVDAAVPEGELLRIKGGQVARVTDAAGSTIEARVREVAPTVDPKTRLGTVHVELPRDSGLRPGMFARVEIETEPRMAVVVPQRSVVWSDGRPVIFQVGEDGAVTERAVETGLRKDGWVEIRDGAEAGARVAVEGAGFLSDGTRVRVDTARMAENGVVQ